jgi:hypothetical protein
MRAATDADFNAQSRYLALKLEIYFNGLEEAPLTITKDDYLIDAGWLEEGAAESSNPFGSISSNELTFRLYNNDGMFSPTNTAGPYFGLIKSGICVIPYIRPISTSNPYNWIQLGKYYVTGWTAAITNVYADITANDKWQQIFNSATPNYKVGRNLTFKETFDNVFTLMGHTVLVNAALTQNLIYSFIEGTPQQFLQDLAKGALVYFSCNKEGTPIVNPLLANRTVRATLTDSNQVIAISSKQSIIKAYDGVELTYSIPQGITQEKLVELQGIQVIPGTSLITNISFNVGPIWQINSIALKSISDTVELLTYLATPWLISLSLNNAAAEVTPADITIYGTTISFTDIILSDDALKLLKIASKYIQDAAYAGAYKNILSAFVSSAVPLLTVTVRGNPLLNIGDRVIIQSTKYNLTFDGIIQRMKYDYVGSLDCEMTLLNNNIVQEVT